MAKAGQLLVERTGSECLKVQTNLVRRPGDVLHFIRPERRVIRLRTKQHEPRQPELIEHRRRKLPRKGAVGAPEVDRPPFTAHQRERPVIVGIGSACTGKPAGLQAKVPGLRTQEQRHLRALNIAAQLVHGCNAQRALAPELAGAPDEPLQCCLGNVPAVKEQSFDLMLEPVVEVVEGKEEQERDSCGDERSGLRSVLRDEAVDRRFGQSEDDEKGECHRAIDERSIDCEAHVDDPVLEDRIGKQQRARSSA